MNNQKKGRTEAFRNVAIELVEKEISQLSRSINMRAMAMSECTSDVNVGNVSMLAYTLKQVSLFYQLISDESIKFSCEGDFIDFMKHVWSAESYCMKLVNERDLETYREQPYACYVINNMAEVKRRCIGVLAGL